MQTLFFEAAWDKTIAEADRDRIIHLFEKTKNNTSHHLDFIPIKQAINHKEDLLITTLIHNFTVEDFILNNLYISYWENDNQIASDVFNYENLVLKPKTSMPWTFIFPKNSWQAEPVFSNCYLIVKKDRQPIDSKCFN